jgi:hypothetical protein
MSEETDALFQALFSLEEVRELLRQTAPKHKLNEEQKKKLKEKLGEVRKALEVLERLE